MALRLSLSPSLSLSHPLLSLSFSLCLLSLSLPSSLATSVIDPAYTITDFDLSDKQGSRFFDADGVDDDLGMLHIGAPADRVGQHFGTLRDAIRYSGGESKLVTDTVSTLSALATDAFPMSLGGGGQNNDMVNHSIGTTAWSLSLYPFLKYFGGPVMTNKKANEGFLIYVVYYGKLWTANKRNIVESFLGAIKPANGKKPVAPFDTRTVTNWWKIITDNFYEVSGGKKRYVTWNVTFDQRYTYNDVGSITGKGTQKNPLSDADIRKIVKNAIKAKFGIIPTIRSLVLVLTDASTYVESFCQGSCSYHSNFRALNRRMAYAHVGDSSVQCPNTCTFKYFSAQGYEPANDDLGIDGMVSWIAHELVSVATNPFQSRRVKAGWVVATGDSPIEVGDFCEWDYGYYGFILSGSKYASFNVMGNKRYFLIQRNWDPTLRACTMFKGKLDTPIPFVP